MDHGLVVTLNGFLLRHDGVEDPITLYERYAELLFAGGLVLAFLVAAGRARQTLRRMVVAAGLSAGAALALAQLITKIVERPRPFVATPGDVHLFAAHAIDAGFPSDHATAAFAIAVAILLRHRVAGIMTLVPAALLAVGRVAIGVHYPSDVLAGALLGTAVAVALWPPAVRAVLDRVADLAGGALDTAIRRS
jgi:undecaprenyl-diphosphatase